MLFLLSYSLFLRIDVNRALVRKNFFNDINNTSSNTTCLDPERNCLITCSNGSDVSDVKCPEDKECFSDLPQRDFDLILICHPDPEFKTDTSRIAFVILVVFLAFLFCVKLFWVVKNWIQHRTLEPSKLLTLATTVVAIIFLIIAIVVDGKNITLLPTGVLDWDSGFLLLVLSVLLITLYLITCLVFKLFCHNVFGDQIFIEYFKDPEELMQWFTLIAAIIAVLFKNKLMEQTKMGIFNGTTALSIATAAAVLVIKLGHSSVTSFGNFATMFHIILRKIPAYFMAVLILVHGFSFGFWILESSLDCRDQSTSFTDYFMSGISVLMMSFGLAEFDFEGAFKYPTSAPSTKLYDGATMTVVFSYILLCLMVLFICLGVLNLLLSTVIMDHKEGKKEVILCNLIFMAKYSIWLDYSSRLPSRILVPFFNCIKEEEDYQCFLHSYINTKVEVEKCVKYCARSYCPQMIRPDEARLKCPINPRGLKEAHGNHCKPHFEWILSRMLLLKNFDVGRYTSVPLTSTLPRYRVIPH